MYGGYDSPPWACGEDSEDYEHCEDSTEYFVLRMLKTYCMLVTQRYSQTLDFKRTSLSPGSTDFRKAKYKSYRPYDRFYDIAGKLQDAGVEDPEPFIAYIFEWWMANGGHDKYLGVSITRRNKTVELSSTAGYGYPSIRFICEEGHEFLEDFLNALSRGYKPRHFITHGNLEELSFGKILDEKIAYWAACMELTEEDYWRKIMHWHYPYLTFKAAKGSESLKRCAGVLRQVVIEGGHPEYEDVSDEEVYEEFLATVKAAEEARAEEIRRSIERIKEFRDRGQEPEYQNLRVMDPDYEWLSEVDRNRVLAYKDAIQKGKNVNDPSVQQEIEERVNPIDKDHPDTIMYVLYGKGAPRRLDGSCADTND